MNKQTGRNIAALMAGTLFGVVTGSSFAASVSDDFDVKIQIENSCVINSGQTSDMDFGTRQLLTSNFDTTSTIGVTCTSGLPYTIGLSAGAHGPGGTSARHMSNGTDEIAYDLYSDVAGGAHWGNEIGTDTKAAAGTGVAQTHTVYGRVPSQTTPPAGSYLDTVTVTVSY